MNRALNENELRKEQNNAPYQQHFQRYEFKYILSRALRTQIEEELESFLHLDPFVSNRRDKQYFVRSLYFEDPYFTNYYEKIDGIMQRAKFRLRTYTRDAGAESPVFLESKGRNNLRVFKHRVRLGQTTSADFADAKSDVIERILRTRDDNPLYDRFQYELLRKQIRPLMLIDYVRRPYKTRFSPDFRLTFDHELVSTPCHSLFPQMPYAERGVLRGYTIMEVKFSHAMPPWFHRVIRNYDLQRVSVSKVCKGIDAWHLTPKLE